MSNKEKRLNTLISTQARGFLVLGQARIPCRIQKRIVDPRLRRGSSFGYRRKYPRPCCLKAADVQGSSLWGNITFFWHATALETAPLESNA